MSSSVLYMSMSLDGYIAGPNDEPDNPGGDGRAVERLHRWGSTADGDFVRSAPAGELVAAMEATGAILAGRRTVEQSSPSSAYGFVGAGEITAAIVEGLSAEVAGPPAVFLSPRGRTVGRELASRFPNVRVCDSNQDVLSNATSIVLAIRPQVARAVVEDLSLRPDHVVISAMAGVRLQRLRVWAAPAGQIVRAIPLPQAARKQSVTVVYPDNVVARELFTRVGGILVPGDETMLEAFSAATATFAAHLDYLTTIANWLADHGVDSVAATAYTTHIFGQLGQELAQGADALAALTDKHTTPGGINQQFMTDLRREGGPDMVRRALDQILARLRRAAGRCRCPASAAVGLSAGADGDGQSARLDGH
jgi:pyrroline-5-carboxylate reductase